MRNGRRAEPTRENSLYHNLTAERPDKSGENRIRNGNSIICKLSHADAVAAGVNESGCHLSSVRRCAMDWIARGGLAVYVLAAALRAAFSDAYVGVRSV